MASFASPGTFLDRFCVFDGAAKRSDGYRSRRDTEFDKPIQWPSSPLPYHDLRPFRPKDSTAG